MTGTGTQADPFIVDNYLDFEKVLTGQTTPTDQGNVWVEFDKDAENKIINMDEIYPYGAPTISCRAAASGGYWSSEKIRINGNGWTLQNLFCTGVWLWGQFELCDLNIIGLLFEPKDNSACFLKAYTNYATMTASLKNVVIKGKAGGSWSNGFIYLTGYNNTYNAELTSCEIDIEYIGNNNSDGGRMIYISYTTCEHSKITLTIPKNKNIQYIFSGQPEICINNTVCWITTENDHEICPFHTVTGNTGYNVITGSHAGPIHLKTINDSIINSDNFPDRINEAGNTIGITTEQLEDASYLHSLGFPIGVNE